MKKIFLMIVIVYFVFSRDIYIKSKIENSLVKVYIINNALYDITYKYDAKYLKLIPFDNLPVEGVIKSKTKKQITSFMITANKFSLKSKIKWVVGNKYAFHNDSYLYRLPCKLNSVCVVSQGFNGKFSHFGESKYAVDFKMDIGTPIYACRGGLVVMIKDDSNIGGNSKAFIKKANFITIKQDDGTYAKYVHLKKNGVVVKVGQMIKRGELLGYSGNTGYTNGPHLHFIVFKPKNYKKRESLKIKFIAKRGVVTNLKRGDRYIVIK